MVSITNVSAGQAARYYGAGGLTSKDNYYSSAEGVWQGRGAEALGLSGEVTPQEFQNLLTGMSPDGQQLIQSGGEEHNHRAGVDLTFSAPKSVSVLSEVLGDVQVHEAHEKAVQEALRFAEENFAQARVTRDEVTERVETGNLVIAAFNHDVSRELDPQLHTHAVVMNMTQKEDGQWRALSNEALYEQKMLIGQVYRNELAANLRDLGYSIQSDSQGLFEVRGIDPGIYEAFSTRSAQIYERVAQLRDAFPSVEESKLRELATLDSRQAKKDVDPQEIRQGWKDRLEGLGYTREALLESVTAAMKDRTPRLSALEAVSMAADILTEREAVFSREDLLRTAARLSVGDQRLQDLNESIEQSIKQGKMVDLGGKALTTSEMQEIEKDIVHSVRKGNETYRAVVPGEHSAKEGLMAWEEKKGFRMTQGQREAAAHILTSQSTVVGIQGDAGTGKTTMLEAVRDLAEKEGYTLRGLSFTGKAAAEIEEASGIKSQTLHSFLSSYNPQKPPHLVADKDKYQQYASRLPSKDWQKLKQPFSEPELKKATGSKTLVVDYKLAHHPEEGAVSYKVEKSLRRSTVTSAMDM